MWTIWCLSRSCQDLSSEVSLGLWNKKRFLVTEKVFTTKTLVPVRGIKEESFRQPSSFNHGNSSNRGGVLSRTIPCHSSCPLTTIFHPHPFSSFRVLLSYSPIYLSGLVGLSRTLVTHYSSGRPSLTTQFLQYYFWKQMRYRNRWYLSTRKHVWHKSTLRSRLTRLVKYHVWHPKTDYDRF